MFVGKSFNVITCIMYCQCLLYIDVSYFQCLSVNVMLRLVHSDTPRSITREMFKDLCPSLVYQIDSDSCHTAHTTHASDGDRSAVHDHFFSDHEHHSHEHGSNAESVRINLIMVPAKGIHYVSFCNM